MTTVELNRVFERAAQAALNSQLKSCKGDTPELKYEADIYNVACRVIAGAIRSLKEPIAGNDPT